MAPTSDDTPPRGSPAQNLRPLHCVGDRARRLRQRHGRQPMTSSMTTVSARRSRCTAAAWGSWRCRAEPVGARSLAEVSFPLSPVGPGSVDSPGSIPARKTRHISRFSLASLRATAWDSRRPAWSICSAMLSRKPPRLCLPRPRKVWNPVRSNPGPVRSGCLSRSGAIGPRSRLVKHVRAVAPGIPANGGLSALPVAAGRGAATVVRSRTITRSFAVGQSRRTGWWQASGAARCRGVACNI